MSQRPMPSHGVALAALLAMLVIVLPASSLAAAAGEAAADRAWDRQVLERLEVLHRLPDVLEEVPPAPWYVDQLEAEGREAPETVATRNDIIMATHPHDVTGTAKVLSLAIEFTDVTHRSSNTVSKMQGYLTGSNSMKTYYEEVSEGNLTIDGQAKGWYQADNDMAYYGAPASGNRGDNFNIHYLLREAVVAANPDVDFSQYDTDRNGIIDSICLVHAGQDEATGGGPNAIWSKQTVYPGTLRVDGVYVGYYYIVSEYSPVGVYVHEFGHMLGLPDLYDTDYTSVGVGVWDVMGSGAWNNWGRTPAHMSAWSKAFLGWKHPTTISNYVEGRELRTTSGAGGEVIKVPTSQSQEYFLLENRYRMNYDRNLPGSGLLIWHIDSGVISQRMRYNTVNNDESHKGVDLEEASGVQHLDDIYSGNDGDSGDPWRNDLQGFTPDSTPSSRLYDGTDTKVRVFNISGTGTIMTVDIDFGGDSYQPFMDTPSPIRDAAPGEIMYHNITVGTRSAVGDTITLALKGTHTSWAWLSTYTLNLGSKGTRVVQLRVTPPAGTAVGVTGQVIIEARSQTAGLTAQLETLTVVEQVHLVLADPAEKTVLVLPDEPRNQEISLTNSGNGLENLTFTLDAERPYWGTLATEELSIDVLETGRVRVTFRVPEGTLAGEEELFYLTVLTEERTASEAGEQVTWKPILEILLTVVVDEDVELRWGNIPDAHIMPNSTIAYELVLYNDGNSNITAMVGYQAPPGWLLLMRLDDGDTVTLDAFRSITINATLKAPDGVPAGTNVRIDVSAGVGAYSRPTTMRVIVDQVYRLDVSGHEAKFADPGETVQFNLTVTNLGNGDDRVEVSVVSNGGDWTVRVDENLLDLGTDETDRSREFHAFMTAPVGAVAFEEKEVDVVLESEDGQTSFVHTLSLTVNPVSAFAVEVEVDSDSIDMASTIPGLRKASYNVMVDNTGNVEDLFHVGVMDLPEGWTTEFEQRIISVPPQRSRAVRFFVVPPSDGAPVPALAGPYGFTVHVASELGSGEALELHQTATVVANRGHTVSSLEPDYGSVSGSELTFQVLLVNEGNVPETLTLSAVGTFETVRFEELKVGLAPFGQRVVNVTVELPSVTEDASVDVQVIATSSDPVRQEHTSVPIDVEGRSGVEGTTAFASLAVLAAVAVSVLTAVALWRGRQR